MTDKLKASDRDAFAKGASFVVSILSGPPNLLQAFDAFSKGQYPLRHGRVVTAVDNATRFYWAVGARALLGLVMTGVLVYLVTGFLKNRLRR
jgi:hypothetical protein